MKKKIGCVIMASGMSKRFGENKLLAEFAGKTIVENILDICDIFDKTVLITRSEAVADICKSKAVSCVCHSFPDRNDTVRIGISKMQDVDACVFCAADQPALRRESVEKLLSAYNGNIFAIIRLKSGERIGLPVLFGKGYFYELSTLPKGKGGHVLFEKYPDRLRYVDIENEMELFDVDTKEDLSYLKSWFKGEHA